MKTHLIIRHFFLYILSAFSISLYSQAPAQCKDVMLQGFFWDSNATTSWTQLYKISGDISGYFDLVWLPPSACSTGGTGYIPLQWSNQYSEWGSTNELKQLITKLHSNNCRSIADIVVNHRGDNGVPPYTTFYPEDFGEYGSFQLLASDIVNNDDVPGTGSPDSGDGFNGARDLDHYSSNVQNTIKAYLQWLKNDIGYDGWRYDMVKGFTPSVISSYNSKADAYMSVGEYWDSNYDPVWSWIQGTSFTSTAFDFPQKYAALNNGLKWNNYANMAWNDGSTPRPAGLAHSHQSRRFAVTFVDNHDTYRDNSRYTGDILKAYAFILSSPGIPCVFYPHWVEYRSDINDMIKARKSVGLHSESVVEVQNTNGYYKAYSVGTCGEMLTYIGSWSDIPVGYTLVCFGDGWAMYTKLWDTDCETQNLQKLSNGVNPVINKFSTATITVTVPPSWTTPKIHVWNKGVAASSQITSNAWPGDAMTHLTDNKWTITLSGFELTDEVGIVFNNGNNSSLSQTYNLSALESESCWDISQTASVNGKYTAEQNPGCVSTEYQSVAQSNSGTIYPNPAKDKIHFNSSAEIKQIIIYSLSSSIVMQADCINNSVDVSSLSPGIYFVKCLTAAGETTGKFIKE